MPDMFIASRAFWNNSLLAGGLFLFDGRGELEEGLLNSSSVEKDGGVSAGDIGSKDRSRGGVEERSLFEGEFSLGSGENASEG